MLKPVEISDDAIASADGILTFDPETGKGHTLWGQDCVARLCPPGRPAHRLKMVDVSLRMDDRTALLELLNRIERIRGRLPVGSLSLRGLSGVK